LRAVLECLEGRTEEGTRRDAHDDCARAATAVAAPWRDASLAEHREQEAPHPRCHRHDEGTGAKLVHLRDVRERRAPFATRLPRHADERLVTLSDDGDRVPKI